MADILAYAEARDGKLGKAAREAVSTARAMADALGGEVHALALGGSGIAEAANELAGFGADRIFVGESGHLQNYAPEAAVGTIAGVQDSGGYDAIVFVASAQGKDLAPRVAARLDCGLATEIVAWEVSDGKLVVRRPMYAGKALATLRFTESPALISLRPNVFAPEKRDGRGEVEHLNVPDEPGRIRVRGIEHGEQEALDVSEASIIVSGGRGMQDPANWSLLEDLVGALGAEATLGASRAVVDAGWRPHSEQVGQTGKTVSPNLYFAVGISGAIQHLAGMRTAKVIVAVNKDPEAPIFSVADYGLVGDLFEVLPRLSEEIERVRQEG
jgi:electron transfer flavoprotein alpha subunit